MILVLPQPQTAKRRIDRGYPSIVINVEQRERREAIGLQCFGLRCEIAEQFTAVVDDAVSVAIQRQPRVI